MNRRQILAGAAGVVATAITGVAIANLRQQQREKKNNVLRIGVMSNLTHAPLLAGLGSGRLQAALAPLGITIEARVFRAGPRVTEALLGDAIDVGTSGPAPVVIHHARHRSETSAGSHVVTGGLRILSGVCSGGASLIVTEQSGIKRVNGSDLRSSDLRGKRIAVTQLGTTQDIALRSYLHSAGLRDAASGGDVTILALAGATILDQMSRRRGAGASSSALDAAWLPEPWATRIVTDIPSATTRVIDERDLWPDHRFSTAVLVTKRTTADEEPAWMLPLVAALDGEVERTKTSLALSLIEAHTELKKHVGNPGSLSIFQKAAAFVDFTSDPIRSSIERFGDAATTFGFCHGRATQGLFSS